VKGSKHITRFAAAGAVAVIAGFAVNGVTAANTVPNANVGDGSGTVSGYTITNVSYNLNATSPQNVDTVTFTTSAAAGTVKIKLVAAGSTWYSCASTNAPTDTTWSCDTTVGTQATAAAIDELRVVATDT